MKPGGASIRSSDGSLLALVTSHDVAATNRLEAWLDEDGHVTVVLENFRNIAGQVTGDSARVDLAFGRCLNRADTLARERLLATRTRNPADAQIAAAVSRSSRFGTGPPSLWPSRSTSGQFFCTTPSG